MKHQELYRAPRSKSWSRFKYLPMDNPAEEGEL